VIAVTPRDAGYPQRALALEHAPDPLWIDGDRTSLAGRAVAIVGTRRMTAYGERVSRELAAACARAGVVVVSGFAQGIDAAAHRGALDAGGRTVAVLGEGIALFLATVRGRRRPLVPRIRANGALVSQFAPNFCAQPWTFVKRNATIAALAEVVVVVEAGEVSGALITAADARLLGRPLFAVPGPIGSAASLGANALIASGKARALISAAVLLEVLGEHALAVAVRGVDPVLEALASGPLDLDSLARRAGRGRAAVEAALATHLLDGSVVISRDGTYRRP